MARRHDPFDKQSAAFSVVFHLLLFVLAWVTTLGGETEFEFLTYEIELVSPPTTVQAETQKPATEEFVVKQPDPTLTPPEPEPEEEEVAIEEAVKPDPPKPEPEPVEEVAEERTAATTTEKPTEDAAESGEEINVRLEGVRRDYPVYYNNIIRQIGNCFRPPRGVNVEATVRFYINADGSVVGMEFVTRSGNSDFDFGAMGAIECAGGGRFGPLPDELPFDRLPVQFNFRPSGEPMSFSPGSEPSAVGTNQ